MNGFLSKSGEFIESMNRQHFDIARKILGDLGYDPTLYAYPNEPTLCLCNNEGYIIFGENFTGCGINDFEFDYILSAEKYKPTAEQLEWIMERQNEFSDKQKETMNKLFGTSFEINRNCPKCGTYRGVLSNDYDGRRTYKECGYCKTRNQKE